MANVQLKDKNDIELYILCLMEHIGYPLDFYTLNDIVIQDDFVNNIDFLDCLCDLVEKKLILKSKQEGKVELYSIAKDGIFVAQTLRTDLSGYIYDRGLKSAMRLISFKKSGSKIECDYKENKNGKYDFNCIIKKQDGEIMNMTIQLDSKFQCERMRANFSENSEMIYKGVLSLLSGEIKFLFN